MERLVDEGLVRNIGVRFAIHSLWSLHKVEKDLFHSNYNGALLLDLQRYARIKPAVLQIEHHPYLVQQPLLDLVKALGIAVTAYSSYGPQTWLELNMHHSVPSLFENDVIASISKRHGRSASVISTINRIINMFFISRSKRPASLGDSARDCCHPQVKQPGTRERELPGHRLCPYRGGNQADQLA